MIEVKPVDETSFYQVLENVIELAKQHPVCDHLRADYVKGNDKMARLLNALGFEAFD